jgi:hypothetical protein
MEDLKNDRVELEKFLGDAKRDYVKKALQSEITKVDAYISKQEVLDAEHKDLQKKATHEKSDILYSKISKFGWSDEGKAIKIYITDLTGIKDHPTEKLSIEFTDSSFDFKLENFNGKNFRLCYPELNDTIVADKCKYSIKSSSISITLVKSSTPKWKDLGAGSGNESVGGESGAGLPGMGGAGGMPGMPGMGGAGGPPGGAGGMDMAAMAQMMGGMGGGEGGPPGGAGGMDMAAMAQMMGGMGGAGGAEGGPGGPGGAGGMDMAAMAQMMGGMGGAGGAEGGMPGMPGMDGGPGGAEGGDPNAGMMDMMKKMYEEGDDDTKKMMTEAMEKQQQE